MATHNVITANKWKKFLKKPEQNRYSDKKKERAAHGIKAAREPGIKSDEYAAQARNASELPLLVLVDLSGDRPALG